MSSYVCSCHFSHVVGTILMVPVTCSLESQVLQGRLMKCSQKSTILTVIATHWICQWKMQHNNTRHSLMPWVFRKDSSPHYFSLKPGRLLEELQNHLVKEEKENQSPTGLTKLPTTTWTVRVTSFQRMINNYAFLMKFWNHCLTNEKLKTDVKSRIIGCQSQIHQLSLFFYLNIL